jgi:hypothetical protein
MINKFHPEYLYFIEIAKSKITQLNILFCENYEFVLFFLFLVLEVLMFLISESSNFYFNEYLIN